MARRKSKKKNKILELIILVIIILGSIFYDDINTIINNNSNTTSIKESTNTNVKETVKVDDNSNLKIYYIDVGQADSILINNNGEYALIDAGNNEDGSKLVTYFESLGITEFKYVIGSHAHEDHIGGMDDIINNFKIDTFYMPDALTTTKTFESVLDALEAKSVAFETPSINDTFSLSDATFTVLHTGTDTSDLNNTSLVLRLTYGSTSYLFMGDAPSSVEKTILSSVTETDVLKVGHHGSQYSSTTDFLNKVNPKYAIISVGENNSYGHPKQTTIDKLNALGTKIYRTDESGTVILSSDGENISFETLKTDTNG
jgi:competence protein ComEC